MTKKQRKHYKKEITKKLEGLGVKDEITYKPTGNSSFELYVKDEHVAGQQQFKKEGVPSYQQQNLQRHITKTLLNAGWEACEKFLNSDITVKKKEETKESDNDNV